jgi:UPF0042 nucleotide-binding protein
MDPDLKAPDLSHLASLVLVAGLSGAGKSSAMDLFADSGYFVVDNLPVPLLPNFLAFTETAPERYSRTALLLDVDSRESRVAFMEWLDQLAPRPHNLKVVFLAADNRVILKRYSETRRPHPGFDATRDKTLEDTIQREQARLQPIKETADIVFDTTHFNVHALKRELREFLVTLGISADKQMRINFLSFGFKYGAPIDCDLIVDVRFLKNPYFEETLRDLTGLDAPVQKYVLNIPDTSDFLEKYTDLLSFLIPKYQFEGKAYLNVGIGCTGGKHRSVALAEELKRRCVSDRYLISAKHRDISR